MTNEVDRRGFLHGSIAATAILGLDVRAHRPVLRAATQPHFPQQDPALVREVVGVSHRDFARVQELVEASPALAKASWT